MRWPAAGSGARSGKRAAKASGRHSSGPAYTMTLAQKLAKTTGALVVMTSCVRLRDAAGYRLVFTPLAPFSDDAVAAATELNAAVEAAIALAPEQFLWSYNRYKPAPGRGISMTVAGFVTLIGNKLLAFVPLRLIAAISAPLSTVGWWLAKSGAGSR